MDQYFRPPKTSKDTGSKNLNSHKRDLEVRPEPKGQTRF